MSPSVGSDARCREEVMRRKASADAMPAKNMPGRKAAFGGTQGCLRQEASQVNRQRSAVLRTTVASVTLHVIKAKAKKTVLPVREKWDRHKEPVSRYFRFS